MKRLGACRESVVCPDCNRKRLNPIALAVDFRGESIHSLSAMTISEACRFFDAVTLSGDSDERVGEPSFARFVHDSNSSTRSGSDTSASTARPPRSRAERLSASGSHLRSGQACKA